MGWLPPRQERQDIGLRTAPSTNTTQEPRRYMLSERPERTRPLSLYDSGLDVAANRSNPLATFV
jgi:hypothetical protein